MRHHTTLTTACPPSPWISAPLDEEVTAGGELTHLTPPAHAHAPGLDGPYGAWLTAELERCRAEGGPGFLALTYVVVHSVRVPDDVKRAPVAIGWALDRGALWLLPPGW